MNNTFVCDHCHEIFNTDNMVSVQGDNLCSHCAREETVICSHCSTRIYYENNAGSLSVPLCHSCYDNHYDTCEECGRIIHSDNVYYVNGSDYPYCYDCHLRLSRENSICDYYYKPDPIFYGDGNRFFGVELEIDDGGERYDYAEAILNIANDEAYHMYCKHDGSLDNGFEMVTHPMTLDYHCNNMPWESILEKARKLGYLSHQSSTCGLHVHVNLSAFGNTDTERDTCIARILYFFEVFWNELLRFSRRTPRQLERWASRYGYKDTPSEILDTAKKGYRGRYTCVNLTNPNTIEFRIFRGTLKFNTVIATLQLVSKLCDVAVFMSDDELKNMSWSGFVSSLDEDTYPELIQYLKERRLYVNDAVAAEEEI